ncbi:hypothetical protein KY284_015649 [Solanum tuberosum]|nr:hypothetical protein KY284_015649 [Solanum tuberosum]
MAMAVLDRFNGGNDPEGWILRAEQYFTCLGFFQKDWLPLPYFYLDGEALTWFTWLHRNKQFFDWKNFKEKLLMRFPQRTTSVSMEDTFRAYINYIRYTTFVPPTNSPSTVVELSPVTYSSDLEDAFTSGNTEADHFSRNCLRSIPMWIPWHCLQEVILRSQLLKAWELLKLGMQNQYNQIWYGNLLPLPKFPTSVLTNTKELNSMEEKKSLDNAALFDKSPQRDASGTLAPFTKQAPVLSNTHIRITEIVYPIATWVSLLIPLAGREDMMSNEHLEQDMATRYVVTNSLGSGPPKWKFDLGTFTVGMADLFLDEFFLENVSAISTSVLHFVGLFIAAKNGKSIRGFNDQHILSQFPFIPSANFIMLIVTVPIRAVDLCVWDPGIDFGFMALTSYIKRTWRNYYCWDVMTCFS